MRRSTLAILLGATGAVLGLKALYKAYKLEYELSEECDEDEGYDEGCDKDDAVICVHRIVVPVPKCEDTKSEGAESEVDPECAGQHVNEAESETAETETQVKPKPKRTVKPKETDGEADEKP